MINIKYKLYEIDHNVCAVVIPDDYDRAMVFLRVQEYNESTNNRFRGNSFNIWKFIKWYSSINNNVFTYPKDWAGFNIPYIKILKCYKTLKPEHMTDYDQIFLDILDKISSKFDNIDINKGYIIGIDSLSSITMRHELAHIRFFRNKNYQNAVLKVLNELPTSMYKKLAINIIKMGYVANLYTIQDEMHAYLLNSEWDSDEFSRGVSKEQLKYFHEKLKNALKPYIKNRY